MNRNVNSNAGGQLPPEPPRAGADPPAATLEESTAFKSRGLFVIVNAWLVFHLAASVLSPAAVNPDSQFTRRSFNLVLPYLELMHLAHGWSFFSPEPGASTLLEYEIVLPGGAREIHRIPNFDIRPRLLYHRHFMLTEFLGRLQNVPEEEQELWYRSFARAICLKHNAAHVELRRVVHMLPNILRVQAGAPLDAPESYETTPLRAYDRDELL